jgi:DHA1 family inner membrane transport protein
VKNEKAILYLLAMTNFCHVLDMMVIMPLGNELMHSFKIHPLQFSWLVSSYSISAGISSVLAAAYMDRFDRKILLLLTLSLFGFSTLYCAYAPTYNLFLLGRILTGTFGGLTNSVVIAIVSDLIPYQRRGKAMGILSMAFAFASVLGVPLGLFIADIWDWHVPFLLIFFVTVIITITLYNVLPSMSQYVNKTSKRNPLSEIRMILQDNNATIALILAYTMVLGQFLIIPFITPYSIRNIGVSQEAIKYIYLVGGAFTLFTAPLIGKYSDRIGNHNMYRIMLICSLFPIFAITNLVTASLFLILIITTSFFIFSSGRMIPAQTMITGAVPAEIRGGFLSLRTALIEFGAGTASLISGWIVTELPDGRLQNYNYVGYLSITIAFSTIFIASRVRRVE